jgi:hypothetical protein
VTARRLSPYRAILSARFRMLLQYRAAALAGLWTQIFFGLVLLMIYEAFYRSTMLRQPMTFAEIVTYVWLGQALLAMLPWNADAEIRAMIRSGAVAYELCRPIDLYSLWSWLGRSFPVEDQRDRRRLDHVSRGVEQEPLAVGRDDVLLPRQEVGVDLCSKERHRGAENDLSVRAECHADRGQLLIGGNIEEFRPVFCPAHVLAAARRDLNPITGAGKRPQVNLEMTRVIRLIRDPLAVERKLSVAFTAGRVHERSRRAVGTERHIPEVHRRPRRPRVKEHASVGQHVRRVNHRGFSEQGLLRRAFGQRL